MTWGEILTIPNGMLGGFVWMGLIRAVVRDKPDADVRTFKAMVFMMVLTTILVAVLPQYAIGGTKGAMTTLGYVIVMAWFWKSRELDLVQGRIAHG